LAMSSDPIALPMLDERGVLALIPSPGAHVGVSMALGAFMVGTLLTTTVFAEQAKAVGTLPKQVLLDLFFIAIGMEIG
jgi:predicted Kef-type K+ transport protein